MDGKERRKLNIWRNGSLVSKQMHKIRSSILTMRLQVLRRGNTWESRKGVRLAGLAVAATAVPILSSSFRGLAVTLLSRVNFFRGRLR